MASRFKLARVGAGVMGAAAVLMMAAAIPASADAARAVVSGDDQPGLNVNVGDGVKSKLSTALIGLRLDGGNTLGMYCIAINTPLDRKQAMVEGDFDKFPDAASPFNQNKDQINWILHESFPVKSPQKLTKLLTDKGVALNDGTLSTQEAIAGTQASIWHFSDGVDLDTSDPVPGDARSGQDVQALYDFLTGADNVGMSEQPNSALAIDPAKRSGTAGDRIGPFTVTTTGTIEKLITALPAGVKITDLDGRELRADQIKNKSQVFFDVPSDADYGSASFQLIAKAEVTTGRLFLGEEKPEATQALIVAQASEAEVSAKGESSWDAAGGQEETPPPAPQGSNGGGLAETGASVFVPIMIGGILVGLGLFALVYLRVRRRAD
jgi:TQXA domain-containing protein